MVDHTWPIAEKIIFNSLVLVKQLYQQLVHEADLLKDSKGSLSIDSITANKKQLVAQLEQLNQQLSQVLKTENLPNDKTGISQYFHRAKTAALPTAETEANWTSIQHICAECKVLNERNGASIELLAQHAKRALAILKGKPLTANTYGRDGITKSDPLSHTLTFYL